MGAVNMHVNTFLRKIGFVPFLVDDLKPITGRHLAHYFTVYSYGYFRGTRSSRTRRWHFCWWNSYILGAVARDWGDVALHDVCTYTYLGS